MLTAWWRKKPAASRPGDGAGSADDPPIRVGRVQMPDEPGYDRSQWEFPFDDLSWTGSETPPPAAFFAIDDAGAPDTELWRADGWWLRALPSPKLPPPEVAAAGPGDWTLTAEYTARTVEPKRPRPLVRPMPSPVLRGSDRIERLREFFAEP